MVFTEALNVPVQERAAFLERACAGDENLRRKVEAYSAPTIESEIFWKNHQLEVHQMQAIEQIATYKSVGPWRRNGEDKTGTRHVGGLRSAS